MKDLVSNPKALFNYEVIEVFESGIVLTGTEIKSLRQGGGILSDSYALIKDEEAWICKMSIAHYSMGNLNNHDVTRERKLLLKKKELLICKKRSSIKGYSLIPIKVYLKRGFAKVSLAIAKGKKRIDKRASIRKREDERAIHRIIRAKN